jgi:hypothetical protein
MNISKKTIIIAIIALVVIAGLTTALLLIFRPSSKDKTQNTQPSATASAIMSSFTAKASKGDFGTDTSVSNLENGDTQPLYIYDTVTQKYVQYQTSHVVLVSRATGFSASELTKATSTIKTLLEDSGLSSKKALADKSILASYASDTISCQFSQLLIPSAATQQIRLLCAEDYSAALSVVRDLIELWPAKDTAKYDSVIKLSTVDGDYTVTILRTTSTDLTSPHALVYIKQGSDASTYIGDAAEGESVVSNERYVINKDIKAGLDNAQYGSILSKALSTL